MHATARPLRLPLDFLTYTLYNGNIDVRLDKKAPTAMRHYDICLQTIPGRDAKAGATMTRLEWLRRYLAERAAFSFTDAYKAAQAELATLEAR